ncbi:MAG: PTS sugar transporter subunit IIA [Planctomycetota bacterium]|jgi:mannitol/fructose-specific phosphotransferase system IIA component (Ntr-type)|nr:PTS sugar transporter subunit IIA [Planctomycetota bacterium]MDA1025500.1 PTS sugar transporter subunit IIA [Planctomycetota bacterium]
MKLREIVVEKAIITSLESSKRDEVLGELLDALVASDAIAADQRDTYLKEALKRERKGSTGFGHGVAVPHVKAAGLERLTVAIGISEAGVDFNALDKQPVHSIFLLISPEERPEEHIDAMEAIFGNLSKDQFRRFLRQAGDVEEIITLLEEADAGQSVG